MKRKDKAPSQKKSGSGKHGKLDPEDAALWRIAADNTKPLKVRKGRVLPSETAATSNDDDKAAGTQTSSKQQTSTSSAPDNQPAKAIFQHETDKSHRASRTRLAPAVTITRASPPIGAFDRKAQRRLRSGRVEIEARIDLHGMRQDEAHAALRAFLYRCQNRGLRWVLIITGKGKQESDDPDRAFDMSDMRQRGILRRNVPRWLDEPDIRPLVVSYSEAARHHGGEGALYVHLRKTR